jgi:hypothetical protein
VRTVRDRAFDTLWKEMGISFEDKEDKREGDEGATKRGGKTVAVAKSPQ